jgi:hypothetical protein
MAPEGDLSCGGTVEQSAGCGVADLGDPASQRSQDLSQRSDETGNQVPRRRGPKPGQTRRRYDRQLTHGDPDSLDPKYIYRTGTPVDDEPGRTARLRWKKGRTGPITEQEAFNVAFRRAAARYVRIYKEWSAERIRSKDLPATFDEALEQKVPKKLPDWDEARESLHMNLPGRLGDYLRAYADMADASASQLVELFIYEQVRSNQMRNPRELREAYERMCEETYKQERAQQSPQATEEDDEYED